jgi:3-oxoadipate enol-lactonase
MWDEVAHQLSSGFTVLRYDQRGHGGSPMVSGPCTIEDLAADAARLIERETSGEVHFVGLSLGGMVAQQIAVQHPELVTSIVVANSSGHYDETFRATWRARIRAALESGMPAVADMAMPRWFTPAWRQTVAGAQRMAQLRTVLEAMDANAYAACAEAVSRIDFSTSNARIACPALVIAGTQDEATPLAMSRAICNAISGAELVALDVAHLSAVEQPVEFAALVAGFINRI